MNKVIAINPVSLSDNEFINYFSDAVRATGRKVISGKWQLREFAKADVVILHWPNSMFNPDLVQFARRNLLKMQIARAVFGTKFVWVVHNLMPHDTSKPSGLARRFVRNLSGLIHLCKASVEMVENEYGVAAGTIQLITVHGTYEALTVPEAPRSLDPEDEVRIGYVGQVKPYKNLERLIQAAAGLRTAGAKLTITGKSKDDHYTSAIIASTAQAGVEADIRVNLIDTSELEQLVDACDCIVLPYSRVLNSGSALFCLSRRRPIIVPSIGALPELSAAMGPDWVYLYDGDLTAETLAMAVAWLRSGSRKNGPNLADYSWSKVRDDLGSFLDRL